MPKLKLLSIDAFGTLLHLINPLPLLAQELKRLIPHHAISDALMAEALMAEVNYYKSHMQFANTAQTAQQLKDQCATQLFNALGAPFKHLAASQQRDCLDTILSFELMPHARDLISWAKHQNLKIAICSNWDYSLRHELKLLGLYDDFDFIHISAEVGSAKPQTEFFHHLMVRSQLEGQHILHLGDDLVNDVEGAKQSGMHALLLSKQNRSDHQVNCLSAVPDYLQARFTLPHQT